MFCMRPESGQNLSHYRLLENIGASSMGVVWKAEDTILGRIVAIIEPLLRNDE